MPDPARLVVVTGGPFSGKTTLVGVLAGRGFATVDEAAIDVIGTLNGTMGVQGQRSWRRSHPLEFQQMVFELQVHREEALEPHLGPVFLDRGIADGIAYCANAGIGHPSTFRDRAIASGYGHAFVLETLEGFETRGTTGRMSCREDSRRIAGLIADAYRSIGVPVTLVGRMPVEERLELVLGIAGV
ncbi:MAG: ATP-binding protein [Deltaproteobacteria bacterium]|nr:ATP-binding protein [Deltaproteobacteria bacterium]